MKIFSISTKGSNNGRKKIWSIPIDYRYRTFRIKQFINYSVEWGDTFDLTHPLPKFIKQWLSACTVQMITYHYRLRAHSSREILYVLKDGASCMKIKWQEYQQVWIKARYRVDEKCG